MERNVKKDIQVVRIAGNLKANELMNLATHCCPDITFS